MKSRTCTILFALAMAAALLVPQAALAAYIPPGYDYFFTDYGSVVWPGVGTIQLQGFPWPGPADPTPLFPLPPGALPAVRGSVEIQWLDQHGTPVGPDSKHKVSELVLGYQEPVPSFDTIVSRKASVDLTGIGASATIPIEIVWLSLKSTAPIDIGLPNLVDAYVGLHSGDQTDGKAKFVSALASGNSGTVDIGLKGVTPYTDPSDPDFLGLPVTYDVLFIPHGMDPIPANVAYRQDGLQAVFQGDTMSPSGQFDVVPEPSTLMTLLLGVSGLVFRGRLLRPSNA